MVKSWCPTNDNNNKKGSSALLDQHGMVNLELRPWPTRWWMLTCVPVPADGDPWVWHHQPLHCCAGPSPQHLHGLLAGECRQPEGVTVGCCLFRWHLLWRLSCTASAMPEMKMADLCLFPHRHGLYLDCLLLLCCSVTVPVVGLCLMEKWVWF